LSAAGLFALARSTQAVPFHIRNQILRLPADGRFHALGQLVAGNGGPVEATAIHLHGLPGRAAANGPGEAELQVEAPVLPGDRVLQVNYGGRTVSLPVHFVRDLDDTGGDGTPDLLHLHEGADRRAFRGWFTAMAEAAANLPREQLPREVNDCAALLRWCYRNALHAHDEPWLLESPAIVDRTMPSVRQYAYPFTPLGAGLFRVSEGSFVPGDERNGAFAQFADAQTLWHRNTFLLGRDVRTAQPGDLLFFRQPEQSVPYHSMIVAGRGQKWVIYHTGPSGQGPGEVRRVLLADLLTHPDPRWRPLAGNSNFLGVYRWNILNEDPR
jgi:uncharacterized protein YfaT (DUF1175 family)